MTTALPASECVADRLGLMRVELRDAARLERRAQPLVERVGKRGVLRRNGRQAPHGGDVTVRSVRPVRQVARGKPVQCRVERSVSTKPLCDPYFTTNGQR